MFASRLRELRDKIDLYQWQVAEKLGMDTSTLQTHEAGQWPNRANLEKYITFYGCSRAWLMTGEGESFPGQPAERERGVSEATGVYESDPLLSAISILKHIFDSGNQTLIQAITLNLLAFQHALQTSTKLSHQSEELDAVKTDLHQYQKRLQALEDKMNGSDQNPPIATSTLRRG